MKHPISAVIAALGFTAAGASQAATFMDAEWASQMCKAWNASPTLTKELGGKSWAANNAGRGYKVIQLYRTKCGEKTKVELELADKDGKAVCTYGGAVKHAKLDLAVDYVMNATDDDWTCMGEGKFGCGAMGAMMTGKLKFQGPKGEAMGVMGPFDSFLTTTGKVPGDKTACP